MLVELSVIEQRYQAVLAVVVAGDRGRPAKWNLVDEFTLLIHPLVLGSGRSQFPTAVRPPSFG